MTAMQATAEAIEVEVSTPKGPLTRREVHILTAVAEGLGNKQIAIRLGISENTVHNHLSHVFGKLRASNRTEAVLKAMRLGLQVI